MKKTDMVIYDEVEYVASTEILASFNEYLKSNRLDINEASLFVHKNTLVLCVRGQEYIEVGTPFIAVGKVSNGEYVLFGCNITNDTYTWHRYTDLLKIDSANLKFELRQGEYISHLECSRKKIDLRLESILNDIRFNVASPLPDGFDDDF